MTVQDSVLQILANENNELISGEKIANDLGVSRAAVWKAIQKLQESGLDIQGTRNKGYFLNGVHDPVTESGITKLLSEDAGTIVQLMVKQSTGSTNNDLKELAERIITPYSCIVAGEQTAGKGRRGRKFFSLGDKGVYLSLLLKPESAIDQAGLITGAAAVAVCRSIQKTLGFDPSIKWVNDIYIDSKKVCGILTEGAVDLECGHMAYAIVGIGVNVYLPNGGFPEEISQRAGCLSTQTVPNLRNTLAATIINECVSIYQHENLKDVINEYRELSMMPGKTITVIRPSGIQESALALGVNEDLSLTIEHSDGSREMLHSGEVSVAF